MSDEKKAGVMMKLDARDKDFSGNLNSFLAEILRKGKVSALLVPQKTPSGGMVFPALVSDPEKMQADPLAPVLPVPTAALVMTLTREGPLSSPVAVLIRNCQIRALMELVKLKQADLANVILIGMDCPGTFSINDYTELGREKSSQDLFLSLLEGDRLTDKLRTACQICREPIPDLCDVLIGVYGTDISKGFLIQANTEKGGRLLEGMTLGEAGDGEARDRAVQKLKDNRKEADKKFREKYGAVKGIEEILKFYARCINCQNCRRVCPICYCQECFFCSEHLAQTSESLMRKSRACGAFKMPLDTLLFHTGRMNHMILSCVECGLCEQACPVNIPLMQVLKRVAKDAQDKFGYSPGRSLEEEMPLAVFHEDEFKDVGEK